MHFTFGFGPHMCLGAPLARMEMTEALRAMADRVASFELVDDIVREPMVWSGSVVKLPVRIRNAVAA